MNDVVSLHDQSFRNAGNSTDALRESAERYAARTVSTPWYVLAVSSEVDVTLVQETLALTPQQRIQQNDRVLRMIEELRSGVAKSRKPARDASDERR